MNVRPEQDGIVLRHPQLADSPELWHLVKAVGTLDLNSSYAYVLMCRHFAHTCVLAELDGQTVGFVPAIHRPSIRLGLCSTTCSSTPSATTCRRLAA